MRAIKGPGIFLAQFLRDTEPYNNLPNIGNWVAGLGYKAVQIPTWDSRVIDLDRAARSKAYCDDLKASLADIGLEISELAAYLQGQVLAIHPAYETFDAISRIHLLGLWLFYNYLPTSSPDLAKVYSQEWSNREPDDTAERQIQIFQL